MDGPGAGRALSHYHLITTDAGGRGSVIRVAVLFPGQGSQYVGMADPWMEHPHGRKILEAASAVLGWDVADTSRDAEALKRTDIVQPAVFTCDVAAFEVLKAEGIPCHVAAGHSLGEYAALVASGAVEFESGLSALATRATAMASASTGNPGTMTALIGMSPEEAHEVCEVAGRGDVLAVANENGPKQTVLSGSLSAIERAEEVARSRGAKAVRLNVAGAFHSPLMTSAVQPVREAISRIHFATPDFPLIPNASGKPTSQPLVLRDLLSRHLISAVRWDASMRAMAEMGVTHVLEAGPGNVLGKLARRAIPDAAVRSVATPDDARSAAAEIRAASAQSPTEEAP
jgi:[acyl-carrier-protein] S-malonyltransferase